MSPQATLDNLIAASKIPSTVAVFVGALPGDLPVNEQFTDFLAGELLTWVRTRYNVTSDAAQTVITGVSLGGVGASYAALRHPEVFGNVLSQSGSFWWGAGSYGHTGNRYDH